MTKKSKTIQNISTNSSKLPEISSNSKSNPKGGSLSFFGHFGNLFGRVHTHVDYLNSNKFFAGIIMLTLNIGSRFVTIELSKSTESFLKWSVTRQLLIFAICWMGTRDIYISLVLTAVFIVLADHVFNHESQYCMLPKEHKQKFDELKNAADTDGDGIISDKELQAAIDVLQKAKKMKEKMGGDGNASKTQSSQYNPIQLR
jgi:hypothetical protein